METDAKIAKAGSLLMLEEGEWSDYTVMGFFVVLKTFRPNEALIEYLATLPEVEKPEYDYPYNDMYVGKEEYKRRSQGWKIYNDSLPNSDNFLAFLLSNGLLLEIEYGRWNMDFLTPGEIGFYPVNESNT